MSAKDIFLSHASEDKDKFIRPLVKEFSNFSIRFWLDEFEIGWGDSIVRKINEGLARSKYVLVLLTDNFLNKNWTKTELECALSAEISNDKIIVLPIMAANPGKVFKTFPLLRNKLYLNWNEGATSIALKLSKLLKRDFKNEWIGGHPAEYTGKVWIQILKQEKNLQVPHSFTIRWGPWRYHGRLSSDINISVTLVHAKSNDGLSIPIFFEINPPCYVTFGQGEPLGSKIIDINYGWKRMS